MDADALKWYEKPVWIIGVAVGIPILLVVFTVLAKLAGFEIKCSDTILTLVGILATFVVIGNYVQVSKMEEKIRTLETKITSINNKYELIKQQSESRYVTENDISVKVLMTALERFASNNSDKGLDITPFTNMSSKVYEEKSKK